MERSEQIGTIAAALAKAQGEIHSASKSTENTFYKSRYADLSAVMEACRVPLSKNGIAVIQSTQFNTEGKWIETILVHSSGEWVSSHYPVKPVKDDPQGMGSAVTYARRYALMALVGIVADDDDDGNAASGKSANGNGHVDPLPPLQRPKNEDTGAAAAKWVADSEKDIAKFTGDDLVAWESRNAKARAKLQASDPALAARLDKTIRNRYAATSALNG